MINDGCSIALLLVAHGTLEVRRSVKTIFIRMTASGANEKEP
jgi:hypothetical protein